MKDGKAVPPGQIGEIWIRGPNIMKEYWRDAGMLFSSVAASPGLTAHIAATDKVVTKDGWFMTGDLGLCDEEGFVYIRDRSEFL